jgi:glyceraldehyde-3-phosphate dehydrogenase/erythrose-4-phosphate dehydrogenase
LDLVAANDLGAADNMGGLLTYDTVYGQYEKPGVTTDPVVSSDIIKDSRASVVDLGMTQVVDGDLIEVMSWYDNEWGYASQIVREALRIAGTIDHPQGAAV